METKMTKDTTKQSRRDSRVLAMQVLYHYDMIGNLNIDVEDLLGKSPNPFTNDIIHGVIDNLEKIDEKISENLSNYTIDRLSFVDRALVRAATFEFMSKTPANIVINETLEMVKEYSDLGDGKNKRFVHSLIDKINKSL